MTTRPRPGPASNPPPLAVPALVERCMGNASIAALLLDKFEAELRADVVAIERQIAAGDAAELRRTAHALKGAAGAVAAAAIGECAARIEACAREDRVAAASKELDSLRAETQACIESLPAARRALAPARPDEPAGSRAPL